MEFNGRDASLEIYPGRGLYHRHLGWEEHYVYIVPLFLSLAAMTTIDSQ